MSGTDKGGRRCSSPAGRTATESQKAQARNTKDDLEDALSDLNRSTNRLRRKFDPTAHLLAERQSAGREVDRVAVAAGGVNAEITTSTPNLVLPPARPYFS